MSKFVIVSLLFIAACAPRITPAQQHAIDIKTCNNYGFKQGTKDFASCLMTIDQNRKTQAIQQQQVDAANAQATGALMSGYGAMQPRTTNCNTYQTGTFGSVSCR